MNFSDKSRYDRIFQQVTHKGREYAMNYIKRYQNTEVLSMHTFLYNFHQGGKYSA